MQINNKLTELSFELNNEIINLVFYFVGFLFMFSCIEYEPLAIFGAGMAFGAFIIEINVIARILFKKGILFKNKGEN